MAQILIMSHEYFKKSQIKNTNIFLSPENTSMKEIQAEINWPRIGLRGIHRIIQNKN